MSAPRSDGSGAEQPGGGSPSRVSLIHRVGAAVVALVILVFGVLGFVGGLGFFDTQGASVAGLSTNGALSTVSVVTAVVLLAAAARGGRLASTVMIVVGALFLISAFVNLWLIGTSANLLAFRYPNVGFSIVAGLVLLFLGAYGRVTGRPPRDNPYAGDRTSERGGADEVGPEPVAPGTAEDAALDAEIADAERALATGAASDEQRRRLAAVAGRSQEERRRAWRSSDRSRDDSTMA